LPIAQGLGDEEKQEINFSPTPNLKIKLQISVLREKIDENTPTLSEKPAPENQR